MLSGGNLQKVILAREISGHPALMIAVHPTRGLDVGATETVHNLLVEQRDSGAAILLISEDLDELLALADRVAVMYEGRIIGEMPGRGRRHSRHWPDDGRHQGAGMNLPGTSYRLRVETRRTNPGWAGWSRPSWAWCWR